MTLKATLDKWAEKLAKKAEESATPLQESIDAFKAVTAYYTAQQKRAKKSDDDEPEEGDFSFAKGIGDVPGQRAKVRAGRN